MCKITSIKYRLIFISLLCSFLTSENVFSKQWSRDFIKFKFEQPAGKSQVINILCVFFDYEFGPNGEHAFLEQFEFIFSETGASYEKLFSGEVKDQVPLYYSSVTMKDKLDGAAIKLINSATPEISNIWFNRKSVLVDYAIVNKQSAFNILWHAPVGIEVKYLIFKGRWHVNGLNCSRVIDGERYEMSYPPELNTGPSHENEILQPELKALSVYSEADAVVVKGAEQGENIRIYTTAGTFVKSMVADRDVLQISLPANQLYIVQVGQARYKVAL